jgi:hypothetical protein
MAIEVEISPSDATEVRYENSFLFLSDYFERDDVGGAVRRALTQKHPVWNYEEEVRIVTTETFYKLAAPIGRIIVGPRMSPPMVNALYLICSHYGIRLERAIDCDWGLETVGAQFTGRDPTTRSRGE